MRQCFKILLYSGLLMIALTAAVISRPAEEQPAVSAQGTLFSSTLRCDEPIPVGEVIAETLGLLDEILEEYQSSQEYLPLGIDTLSAETAELSKSPEEVCQFKNCFPTVVNKSPEVVGGVAVPLGKDWDLLSVRIPACVPKECLGDACPEGELNEFLKDIKTAKNSIAGSYQIIHDLLSEIVVVTEDLKGKYETAGESTITKIEELRRKLTLARAWLHPYSGEGKRTCALSEQERGMLAVGEIGNRFPARCVDALQAGLYWPKTWSEECQRECEDSPNYSYDACTLCLGKASFFLSPLGKINFKIFSGIECGNVCGQGELTEECLDCLCCDANIMPGEKCPVKYQKSEQECTAWLCGGSYFNWTCCHETPLE